MKKVAVLLLNMGGPDSLDAVEPFLYNLFSDHDIIEIPRLIQKPLAFLISKFRAKKTRHYYEIMGGKSPQREQTEKQAQALQKLLPERFIVKVAMRYWKPFTEEAVKKALEEKAEAFILLPMYPQYSKTTTGSSFNEFDRVCKRLGIDLPVVKIKSYHNHPLYIKAMVENIKENVPDPERYFFLFTAHSLPVKVIKRGDPYKDQTEETVRLIMEHFPNVEYALGYQSKVGPTEWLKPETEELLKQLINSGKKRIVLIPVSFTCEHSETLYELDHLYYNLAKQFGVEEFVRVPTLKDHPTYIELLKELSLSALQELERQPLGLAHSPSRS
ncbi:ferrochelatase [Thermocrinis sp.]